MSNRSAARGAVHNADEISAQEGRGRKAGATIAAMTASVLTSAGKVVGQIGANSGRHGSSGPNQHRRQCRKCMCGSCHTAGPLKT
ncbi:hypothetical protein BH18VER1_BH18VER1_12640 [soil metagenome]